MDRGEPLLADLPERRAVSGLGGFRSRSRIQFAALPDDPHEFVATYVFPGRAQWRLERLDDRRGARRLHFFCGQHVFTIAPDAGESSEFPEAECKLYRLRAELRRVGTTWPAGLEWVEQGDSRRAKVPDLGMLLASGFDERGQPSTLSAWTPEGRELERLEAIVWSPTGRWPSAWRLATSAGPVWEETILEVSTGVALLDRYFLPPDRLSSRGAPEWDRAAVQEIALPERSGLRLPLPAALSWSEVREWAAARVRSERLRLGAGAHIEDEPAVEIDLTGRPIAVWLRGSASDGRIPAGWDRLAAGRARVLWLDRLTRLDEALLGELRTTSNQDTESAAPFVWLRALGDGDDGQLVLPLGGS